MHLFRNYFVSIALSVLLLHVGIVTKAQNDSVNVSDNDFFNLSFEDMLNMEVTSVSKKAERLQAASSSLYVLTSEDISNSGATTLHEALRMVPGYWGVQEEYGNVQPMIRNSPPENGSTGTVLYLLDGTPIQDLMSSTFSFHNFDIPLEEIDRIEVIRGSGGTIYGANSATGVINIFTKNPNEYDGINVKVEGAMPGYSSASLRAGGAINDRLSISGYAKYRSFSGYGLLKEFDGDSVLAPLALPGADTNSNLIGLPSGDSIMIKNRFQEDFESTMMYSGGLKLAYKLGENSRISTNTHFNMSQQTIYTNFETEDLLLGAPDSLVVNDAKRSRVVNNFRFDHNFSENHSFFVRTSSNIERDFLKLLGGYQVNNSICDIEVQDNIAIGKLMNLSFGGNYRVVNFDIHDINDAEGVSFINPQSQEKLNGFFIQDKIKLMDEKINFLIGLKGETYSLINKTYYFSPMAKVSYVPTENLTFWGGYTQSYTTPGYINVNIDALFIKTPSDATIDMAAYQSVYDGFYNAQISGGASPAAAKSATDAYIITPGAVAAIGGTAAGMKDQMNNVGVINGSETVPTKYQTWEFGFRANIDNMLSLESNFYYATITDGIAASADASPTPTLFNVERPGSPGEFSDYYLYGNYIKGVSYGTESTIKIIPSKGTRFEVSHIYTHSEWKLQENNDFDINDPSVVPVEDLDRTPKTPKVPKHVFRMRGSFQLPKNFSFTMDMLYATQFDTDGNYIYELQRYPNIVSNEGITVAENNSRTIINLKLQKSLMNKRMKISLFGNDIFNDGIIANTNIFSNVTLSQIGRMYGASISYKFK